MLHSLTTVLIFVKRIVHSTKSLYRVPESCYTRGIQDLECPNFTLNRSC